MLAADAAGDPASMPVLFFHGGGQSRRAWRGTAERVAAAGYYALSFDLRGHGESGWAPDGDYHVRAYARDVSALLHHLQRRVVLVGASRGGQAALIGGSARSAQVSLIMLADVAPDLCDSGVESVRRFFRASEAGFASLDEAADALTLYLGRPRPPHAAGLARAMRLHDGRYYWHWDPRTVAPAFLAPPSEIAALREAAACVTCPVVLVRGEFSDIVSPEAVAAFQAVTPQLIVLEAKGQGHMFTGDANDAFAQTLVTQLARFAPWPS
jgi:pimeloyl-ACP methyl ester carboxylesterase